MCMRTQQQRGCLFFLVYVRIHRYNWASFLDDDDALDARSSRNAAEICPVTAGDRRAVSVSLLVTRRRKKQRGKKLTSFEAHYLDVGCVVVVVLSRWALKFRMEQGV